MDWYCSALSIIHACTSINTSFLKEGITCGEVYKCLAATWSMAADDHVPDVGRCRRLSRGRRLRAMLRRVLLLLLVVGCRRCGRRWTAETVPQRFFDLFLTLTQAVLYTSTNTQHNVESTLTDAITVLTLSKPLCGTGVDRQKCR